MSNVGLPVIANTELQGLRVSDRMSVEVISKTPHYHILSLFCGMYDMTATKEYFDLICDTTPVIHSDTLQIFTADKSTLFYTVDLTAILPEGWKAKVVRTSKAFSFYIGFVAYHPNHEDEIREVRVLSSADLRSPGTPQCEEWWYRDLPNDRDPQCEREAGHLGRHQCVDNDSGYQEWSDGGGGATVRHPPYGFKTSCRYCGEVSRGSATTGTVCFHCTFWLEQKEAGGKHFIINGRHFRPGQGGFGGVTFIVECNDGTKWEGELVTQGKIPSWLAHMFPDNAKWAAESRHALR